MRSRSDGCARVSSTIGVLGDIQISDRYVTSKQVPMTFRAAALRLFPARITQSLAVDLVFVRKDHPEKNAARTVSFREAGSARARESVRSELNCDDSLSATQNTDCNYRLMTEWTGTRVRRRGILIRYTSCTSVRTRNNRRVHRR